MGKRELLLAAGFLLIGVVVYQVTAPAADPSRPRWSVGGILEQVRRDVRGNQAQASSTNTTSIPAPASLREVRILVGSVNVTVVGEDRSDIQSELEVVSNAYDQAEAERTAKATALKVDEGGAVLTLSVDFPREGRQRAALSLKIPSRLDVRVEKNNTLVISNVASLVVAGRGETTITTVAGAVQANQRGSVITINDVGPLRLTTLGGAEARISGVRGDATFSAQGGELTAEALDGSVEIEARNCDVKLENLDKLRSPIRINATGGEVAVLGLQTEIRIDGRETDIRVEQAAAAPLAIYNEGNETVELTLPDAGFKLDAVAIDGRLTVDGGLEKSGVKVASTNAQGGEGGDTREEFRASAVVRGGGPTVTIRANHGDIVLRSR